MVRFVAVSSSSISVSKITFCVVSIVVMNGISEGSALNILKSEGFTMRKVCGPT